MAKQDLSRYQKGIVSRHYEHYDTKLAQRLTELLSDLFIAEQAAKAAPQDPAAAKAHPPTQPGHRRREHEVDRHFTDRHA